jgi:hypothetical protein
MFIVSLEKMRAPWIPKATLGNQAETLASPTALDDKQKCANVITNDPLL